MLMSIIPTLEMNHLPPALTQRTGSSSPREAADANGSAAEPPSLHAGGHDPKPPRQGGREGGRDRGGRVHFFPVSLRQTLLTDTCFGCSGCTHACACACGVFVYTHVCLCLCHCLYGQTESTRGLAATDAGCLCDLCEITVRKARITNLSAGGGRGCSPQGR